jgi:hypothetical protein
MTSPARKSEAASIQLFLRIKHPHLDPVEITRALELEPEYANKAGPAVSARGIKKIHSESYWLAALPVASLGDLREWAASALTAHVRNPAKPTKFAALRLAQAAGIYDMHLIHWLERLESQSKFIKKIVDDGGTVTLVLQRRDRETPLIVGPALSRRLADLEVRLEID